MTVSTSANAAGAVSPLPLEQFVSVAADDPLARPMLDELTVEYHRRYADLVHPEHTNNELLRYPAALFAPPEGAFILLLRDGQPIAGGALMRHAEAETAEFKRIWTRHDLRRQGLAKRVLAELETRAFALGYRQVRLGTGPRQPEAVALYFNSGYTLLARRQFEQNAPPGYLFGKSLTAA